MADKWAELGLIERAAKILEWLGSHLDRTCSTRSLVNWLNGMMADSRWAGAFGAEAATAVA